MPDTQATQTNPIVRLFKRQEAMLKDFERQRSLGREVVDRDQRVATLMWDALDLYRRHRDDAAKGKFHPHGVVILLAVLAGAWSRSFAEPFQHNHNPQTPGVAISIWFNLAFLVHYRLKPETLLDEEGITEQYRSHATTLPLSEATSEAVRTREHHTRLVHLLEELLGLMPLLAETARGTRTSFDDHYAKQFRTSHNLPVLATLAFHGRDRVALQKMRTVCQQASGYDLSQPAHRFAMLQVLVTLGEYSCDRQLTRATKALDNSIDWPLLGHVRLVLCHPAYAWSLSDRIMACTQEDFEGVQADLKALDTALHALEQRLLANTSTWEAQERYVSPRCYLPEPIRASGRAFAEQACREGLITEAGQAAFVAMLDLDLSVHPVHTRVQPILHRHLTPALRVTAQKRPSGEKTEAEQEAFKGRTKLFKTLLGPVFKELKLAHRRVQNIQHPTKKHLNTLRRSREAGLKHVRAFHRNFLRGIQAQPKQREATTISDMLRRARRTWELLFKHLPPGISVQTLAQQEPVVTDPDTLWLLSEPADLEATLVQLEEKFKEKAKPKILYYRFPEVVSTVRFMGLTFRYRSQPVDRLVLEKPTITPCERQMLKAIHWVRRYHRTANTRLQLPIKSVRNPRLHAALRTETQHLDVSLSHCKDDGTIHPTIQQLSPVKHEVASMFLGKWIPPSTTALWSLGGLPIGFPMETLGQALIAHGQACELYLTLLDHPTTQPMLTYLLCHLRSIMLTLGDVFHVPPTMLKDLRKFRNHSVHGHHLLDASDSISHVEYVVDHWSNLARTLPDWLRLHEGRLQRFHRGLPHSTTSLGSLFAPPSHPSHDHLTKQRHVLRDIERLLSGTENDRHTFRLLLSLVQRLRVQGPGWHHHRGVWYALDRLGRRIDGDLELTDDDAANVLKELRSKLLSFVEGELSSDAAKETPAERSRRWGKTHCRFFPILGAFMQRLEAADAPPTPAADTLPSPRPADDFSQPFSSHTIAPTPRRLVTATWNAHQAQVLERCRNVLTLCQHLAHDAARPTNAQVLREVVRLLDVLDQTPGSVRFSDDQCKECLGLVASLLACTKRYRQAVDDTSKRETSGRTPSEQLLKARIFEEPGCVGTTIELEEGTDLPRTLDAWLGTLRPLLRAAMLAAPERDGGSVEWWNLVDAQPPDMLAPCILHLSPVTETTPVPADRPSCAPTPPPRAGGGGSGGGDTTPPSDGPSSRQVSYHHRGTDCMFFEADRIVVPRPSPPPSSEQDADHHRSGDWMLVEAGRIIDLGPSRTHSRAC